MTKFSSMHDHPCVRGIPLAAAILALSALQTARADMRVESLDAAPSTAELASFKDEIAKLSPGTGGNLTPKNDWAQHASGQTTRALGLMYEMTHDRAILDRMIVFCDAVLAARNDLAPAPVGQHKLWTGDIEPAWPNSTTEPIATGGEQGDAIGHLGYCARLILQTPALAHETVSSGDPNGYGGTYEERARRFVKEADFALDQHVLSELLDLSKQNRMYWAAPNASGSVPWNQQVMFTYAFQNLASAHRIVGDDENRAARYDALVQASMDWFFSGETGAAVTHADDKGNSAYLWAYRPPSGTEDWSHSNLDIQGIYRAYAAGIYGITSAQMLPLANTFLDVIRRGPGDYAGRVDGTDGGGNSAPTQYVRPGWYLAALFRPADYLTIVSEDLTVGGTTNDITRFSLFLWIKCKQHADECVIPGADTDTPDAGAHATDAGAHEADSGEPDAGNDMVSDAGTTGAGTTPDAGKGSEIDAAADSDSDAGSLPAPNVPPRRGAACGCRVIGQQPQSYALTALLGLLLMGLRTRARRRK